MRYIDSQVELSADRFSQRPRNSVSQVVCDLSSKHDVKSYISRKKDVRIEGFCKFRISK